MDYSFSKFIYLPLTETCISFVIKNTISTFISNVSYEVFYVQQENY